MARKKLQDLAKIGLGLAAAYGASKVLGKKTPVDMGDTFGSSTAQEIAANRPADTFGSSTAQEIQKSEFSSNRDFARGAGDTFGSSTAQDIAKAGPIAERGSVEAFRADEDARKARIAALRGDNLSDRKMALSAFDEKVRNYNRSMVGAKKGKMIKASKGGSVVARGNKIARSKPTKLF
jgi:hypothetical protein